MAKPATMIQPFPPLPVWRDWQAQSELGRLQAEIEKLAARIDRLKPNSHGRPELAYRVRMLRARLLRLEIELRGTHR